MNLQKVKSLAEVEKLITEAMMHEEKTVLSVLRLIKAKVVYVEKESGKSLDETKFTKVLMGLIKEHKDSIDEYKKAKRNDLVEKEEAELAIISEMLPDVSFSEEDVVNTVNEEIERIKAKNGSVSMKDMKFVMEAVKSKFPFADGKFVSTIAKEKILNG